VSGPLPEGIEVLELADSTQRGTTDLVVEVSGGAVTVIDETVHRLGTCAEVVARLDELAATGRAKLLARYAIQALRGGVATLDDAVQRAELDFRTRVTVIESKRIADPRFAESQLARVQPHVIARAGLLIEQVRGQLGSELDGLARQWRHELTETSTVDDLGTVAGRIDEDSPAALSRIADEAARYATSAIAGAAYDLRTELFAELITKHGGAPPHQHARGPQMIAGELLPSLVGGRGAGLDVRRGWLTGLLRSLDSRRSETIAKVDARAAQLLAVAKAELFDAEPRLRAAIDHLLAVDLEAALAQHAATIAQELAREHAAIAQERPRIAQLATVADASRDDVQRLAEHASW
jgi:hypothetical protein